MTGLAAIRFWQARQRWELEREVRQEGLLLWLVILEAGEKCNRGGWEREAARGLDSGRAERCGGEGQRSKRT